MYHLASLSRPNSLFNHEIGTSKNIKSAQTRKGVTEALRSMMAHIKILKPNALGYAIFSDSTQTTVLEPLRPIATIYYRCDRAFALDLYDSLCADSDVYAYAIVTGEQLDIFTLSGGKSIDSIASLSGYIPGKTRRGGQSSLRYSRLCLEARANLVRRMCEILNETLLKDNQFIYKGLFVAGPADRKKEVLAAESLAPPIKAAVIGIYDVAYGGRCGLNECLPKTLMDTQNAGLKEERVALEKLMAAIGKSSEFLIYYGLGPAEVSARMHDGSCDTILIHSSIEGPPLDNLRAEAQSIGCPVLIVSYVLPQAQQLAGLGGIACTTRYPISVEPEDE